MQTAADPGKSGANSSTGASDEATGPLALQTIGLGFVYQASSRGLWGVDFTAARGEFIALLGPNGSGKTTLLKHFVGLLRPRKGRVAVLGRELVGNDLSWVHRQVGFLWQDPNDQLFRPTVGEDVAFGPRNLGLAPEEISRRVTASLQVVGLAEFADRSIAALSFGEKRRCALAGLLALEPSVLVLDEPTAGLDPLGASQILALLHRLSRREGKTVVMATHDIDLVPAYADLVYVIREGRLVAAGSPPLVFAQTQVIADSHLRLPRAAHALQVAGQELGLALVDLPFTTQGHVDLNKWEKRYGGPPEGAATTGVAAAAAVRAAAELLFHGVSQRKVELRSTLGAVMRVPVVSCLATEVAGAPGVVAEVVKTVDDPFDPTDGARIQAWICSTCEPGIRIRGGSGIGRVASHGLPVPAGEAAINPVPRQMIVDAVADLIPTGCGLSITLCSPNGEELAQGTGNAQMGIVGGIAILGGPVPATNGKIQR